MRTYHFSSDSLGDKENKALLEMCLDWARSRPGDYHTNAMKHAVGPKEPPLEMSFEVTDLEAESFVRMIAEAKIGDQPVFSRDALVEVAASAEVNLDSLNLD